MNLKILNEGFERKYGNPYLKESEDEKDIFHNDNGKDYEILERSESGTNALLKNPNGNQWIIAWNCPKNNKGSWGQGHYFFDEESAREVWKDKYKNESLRENFDDLSGVYWPNGVELYEHSHDMDMVLDFYYGLDRDKDNSHYTREEKQKAVDYYIEKIETDPFKESLNEEMWDSARARDIVDYYMSDDDKYYNIPTYDALVNLVKKQMKKEGSKLPKNDKELLSIIDDTLEQYNESLNKKKLKEDFEYKGLHEYQGDILDIFNFRADQSNGSGKILDYWYDTENIDGKSLEIFKVECDNSNPTYLSYLLEDLNKYCNKHEPLQYDTVSNDNGFYGKTFEFYYPIDLDESLKTKNLKEDFKHARVISTSLKSPKDIEILNSIIGQMSDGIWENSPSMNVYWKNIDITKDGNIEVNDDYYYRDYFKNRLLPNKLKSMRDNEIKNYLANKLRAIVKIHSDNENINFKENWNSTSEEVCDYLGYKEEITYGDAFNAYQNLRH